MSQETPTERMLRRLGYDPQKIMESNSDLHEKYTILSEKKLMRMGYKLYTYDELPKEIKEKLGGGDPDVKAEKNGEWVFVEVSITRRPSIESYIKAGKVILVFPIKTSRNVEVWGEEELLN